MVSSSRFDKNCDILQDILNKFLVSTIYHKIKAAKEFVHQKEKERSIKNLIGKSVMVETKQDTLYGYIDSYDIEVKGEAEEAFVKLRLYENVTIEQFDPK